jgi:hypothetical protein
MASACEHVAVGLLAGPEVAEAVIDVVLQDADRRDLDAEVRDRAAERRDFVAAVRPFDAEPAPRSSNAALNRMMSALDRDAAAADRAELVAALKTMIGVHRNLRDQLDKPPALPLGR